MKRNGMRGIVVLLLWASILTLLALAFFGERLSLGGFLRSFSHVIPLLFAGFYILVFISVKESRLRLLLFLAIGIALSLFLDTLNVSTGPRFLIALGIIALYLLGCLGRALYHSFQLRQALRPLNEAALAYHQRNLDGEAFLAALDQYTPALPKGGLVKRDDIGTITIQEHFDCERIEVLGNLGRLEERRALIGRLRRETKSPGLPAWLNEKEAEFGMDSSRN